MIMNHIKFIIYVPLMGLIFSQSDVYIASELSIIPFQMTPASKPMMHLGGIQGQNGIRLMCGQQFQPTKNLLIGGVLSPYKIETDLSIYYHMVLGYIPQWKFLNIATNMFQIGMHRNRFGADGDSRWYSFSLMESARFGSVNFNTCWNRLFTQDWDSDTILISTDLKLSNNFYIKPGAMVYFTPNIDYIPFLFLSIHL